MGLESLRGRSDSLKWWYKLVLMPEDRYPKQLFSREWETKPRRGRQRKARYRVVDELFVSLGWISINGWRMLRGERVH